MILFEEDYKKYPNCIIDYGTRNKSALDLAYKLNKKGIRNNSFFLVLFDGSLSGVDTHSENLTQEQMIRIGIEAKLNPFYVLREIFRVPSQAGNNSVMVDFNRSIVSFWWMFFNHITVILTQPRQTGKSLSADLLMNGLMNFWTTNTRINLLTLNDRLKKETVDRVKAIYDELPIYLQFKNKADSNNTEEITINRFHNKYKTSVSQLSPKAAYKIGRGLTTPILHVDEPPFHNNLQESLDACLPAMDAAIDMAAKHNQPYGVLYTTTAGKKDEVNGKFFYGMVQKSARWTDSYYDCNNQEELKEKIISVKGTCRVYAEFSHTQLGKSDEWLKAKLAERDMSQDSINRDYFNMWTSGTQSSPLDTKTLEKINSSVTVENYNLISSIGSYVTRWYIPENQINDYMSSRKTIIGIDTSDASGGDDISFVGIDIKTGATIFIGAFNETNLIVFSRWLVWWLETFTNSTMIIERRSTGSTIIDYLLDLLPQKNIDPFKRLFNWVVNNPLEHKERYAETKVHLSRRSEDIYVRCKKYFGFSTSGGGSTSRNELYSTTLQNAAKTCGDRVLDKWLIEQISSLVYRNGRVDHEEGSNDDLVIGWLLSHWFLTMAKNLSGYDINSDSVLTNTKREKNLTAEQRVENAAQKQVRSRITKLYSLLSEELDPFICSRYEQELKFLDSQLILEDDESFSVDATIRKAREENKRKNPLSSNDYLNPENLSIAAPEDLSDYDNVVVM